MNELVLKEMNEHKIVYLYYPEGKVDFGEIEYDFTAKHAVMKKKSKFDESGDYANKAILKVEKCVENNNLPIKFTQAWY